MNTVPLLARGSALLAALSAALVPKCPFCVAAYLALFGVSVDTARAVARPLQIGLLGVAAAAIGLTLLPLGRLVLRSYNRAPRASDCCAD